jgi:hypothetical protein
MDILSSGDPFGKRRLPVDGGIVVISPKAHRLFRPDGIDQTRQLRLGRACVYMMSMMALRGSQEGGRKVGGIAFNEPLAAGSIFIAVDSFIHTYTQIHSRGV